MKDKERVYLKDGRMGIWRTVGGNRIFIPLGKTLSEAMEESGKFPNYRNDSVKNVTEEWRRKARPQYGVAESMDWCIAHDGTIVNPRQGIGKVKTIEKNDIETVTWFKNHFWGNCKVQPGIDSPDGHKSADIRLFGGCGLVEEQTVEIKSIKKSQSYRAIDNQLHKGMRQSENVLLDLKEGALDDLSDNEVLRYAGKTLKDRKEIKTVIVKKGDRLLGILQR